MPELPSTHRWVATSASPLDAARTADGGLDGNSLLRVRRQLAQAGARDDRTTVAAGIAETLGALRIWDYLVWVHGHAGAVHLEGLTAPTEGLAAELSGQFSSAGAQALREQKTVLLRSTSPEGWIVSTPCTPVTGGEPRALAGMSTSGVALKPLPMLVLEAAASEWSAADVRLRLADAEQDLLRTAGVVELLERLARSRSPEESDRRLVSEVAGLFPGSRVVLGRRRHGRAALQVVAEAGGEATASGGLETELAALLAETLFRRRNCLWPAATAQDEAGLLVHRQYVEQHAEQWVASVPLDEADSGGAALVIIGTAPTQRLEAGHFLAAAAAPVAAARQAYRDAQCGPWRRFVRQCGRLAATRRAWVWSLVGCAAAAAMLVPVPHRVECDCAVEPVVRQFVAAPFDAPLLEVLVRPGDEVHPSQPLARLDGREIRFELAGVAAELQRAARERDGHMALHDSGAARLSELEVERLQFRTQWLEHCLSQLEVRSPVAGLVISGDLDQAVGAPLEIGQTLFELAPLEHLLVELRIPERDVPYAQVGQPVRYWLDSQPDEPRVATIARITPRAELHEGASVFVAEVALENPEGWLRPGMHGTARIEVGECRLGWRLFHRAWEAARVWMGI